MTPTLLSLQVAEAADVASGVRVLTLVPSEPGGVLPPFEAGAHLPLLLPSGLVREYSLCSDPLDRTKYRIAVKQDRDGRGGSSEVHERLVTGVVVQARPPANHFSLPPGDAPILLLAGGIGITPILSMLHTLRAKGRRFRLVWLVRRPQDVCFADDLAPRGDEDIAIHVRRACGARFDLGTLLGGLGPAWRVQCCGPLQMIRDVEEATHRLGWDASRLRREIFRSDAAAPQEGDRPFTAKLARTGKDIAVRADQTMLDALLNAGIDVDFSCEEGTCGTCITRLLDGVADHRDEVLTPEEREGHIAVCCSRARSSSLTLDL